MLYKEFFKSIIKIKIRAYNVRKIIKEINYIKIVIDKM